MSLDPQIYEMVFTQLKRLRCLIGDCNKTLNLNKICIVVILMISPSYIILVKIK
jgi:hypothetical protein